MAEAIDIRELNSTAIGPSSSMLKTAPWSSRTDGYSLYTNKKECGQWHEPLSAFFLVLLVGSTAKHTFNGRFISVFDRIHLFLQRYTIIF